MAGVEDFFAYARERHAVHLRRAAGQAPPYTEDPVLQTYRFCNVFRELDRTTVWFAKNVRDRMRQQPEVLLATVLFRLFNRISTGEAIFLQKNLFKGASGCSAFDLWYEMDGGGAEPQVGSLIAGVRSAILTYCGKGPYVTGSYIIKTPDGYDKLDGVLRIVKWFMTEKKLLPWPRDGVPYVEMGWSEYAQRLLENPGVFSLQDVWAWLVRFPFIGDFTAYEIVTDLRHTALLDQAPDIMTWANPGPGAKRGLGWVYGETGPRAWQIEKMRELLEMSRDSSFWPQAVYTKNTDAFAGYSGGHSIGESDSSLWAEGQWPAWEMRDVEHTLCEFDKYTRVQNGGPAPRQRFRGGTT